MKISISDLTEGGGKCGPKPIGFAKRFWGHVRKGAPDECWNWTGCVQTAGYGIICVGTLGLNLRRWLSHRLSYLLHHGEIEDSVLVCHRCDNPRCCNPAHLFLGTHKDNTQDAVRKGRFKFPRPWICKLRSEDVVAIRDRKTRTGESCAVIAVDYGVNRETIRAIVNRATWKAV